MPRFRLLNCDFITSGSFKLNLSNKAKLLYLMMFANGDDRGFVDNTNDIIRALENNDNENGIDSGLTLLNTDYASGLQELVEKGLLYEFSDNHNNKVHLIRHWFYHNKLVKGLWTNYRNFLERVYIENNEYILGKKPLKENNINGNKTKHIKGNKVSDEEWNELFEDNEDDDLPFER